MRTKEIIEEVDGVLDAITRLNDLMPTLASDNSGYNDALQVGPRPATNSEQMARAVPAEAYNGREFTPLRLKDRLRFTYDEIKSRLFG